MVLVKGLKPLVSMAIKLSIKPALKRGSTESVNDLMTHHHFVLRPAGGNMPLKPAWVHCNLKEVLERLTNLDLIEMKNHLASTRETQHSISCLGLGHNHHE
jgi:uncharacterized protein